MYVGPRLPSLLERERPELDRIFGVGAYQIESSHPQEVVVRTNGLEWRLSYDERDRAIISMIDATGASYQADAVLELWAQFLDQEIPPLPSDASPEAQLRNEVEWLGRLWREVFSDPSKARDAAFFVRGYHTAYTDWASGAWDSTN